MFISSSFWVCWGYLPLIYHSESIFPLSLNTSQPNLIKRMIVIKTQSCLTDRCMQLGADGHSVLLELRVISGLRLGEARGREKATDHITVGKIRFLDVGF